MHKSVRVLTPTIREQQRRTIWRALQTAAINLVDEQGFAGVTVDDFSAVAGVSRRTFFNHFPTKAAALFDPDPADADRFALLTVGDRVRVRRVENASTRPPHGDAIQIPRPGQTGKLGPPVLPGVWAVLEQ